MWFNWSWIINFRNRFLGDKYTDAICEGVKYLPDVYKLNLQNNKITDLGIKNIISSLSQNLKVVDLAGN